MGEAILYLSVSVVCFFIGVYVTRWIFDIKTIVSNLSKQTEIIAHQNKIMTAQMELLASIAEKSGVPLKDINDVTTEFGVTFTE